MPEKNTATRFWRDEALPFIEARSVQDGRHFCYAKHSHETFSIGAITAGQSTYINRGSRQQVAAGSVVVMNPGDVHACNPITDQAWSYLMFYIDTAWLSALQQELGLKVERDVRAFATILSTSPTLHAGLVRLHAVLTEPHADPLRQHSAAVIFFTHMQQALDPYPAESRAASHKLARAADFIHAHCSASLKLEDICAAAELSPSYLIRSFKEHYGMTPHAFLLNRRIQLARTLLKQGGLLADVALETGFADQAHFQRAFKQLLATTPGHYQGNRGL